jgi:thymidine kinase
MIRVFLSICLELQSMGGCRSKAHESHVPFSNSPIVPSSTTTLQKHDNHPHSVSVHRNVVDNPPVATARTSGRGSIHLILGPMFSGKTRELKRRLDVHRIACAMTKQSCLLIKSSLDARYDSKDVLCTHNQHRDTNCLAVHNLKEAAAAVASASILFIDEGQFFSDLSTMVLQWVKDGKEIHIAMLHTYATGTLWPAFQSIVPYATQIVFLNAVCMQCGSKEACLTRLKPKSSVSTSSDAKSEVRVGSKELYEANCVTCFLMTDVHIQKELNGGGVATP